MPYRGTAWFLVGRLFALWLCRLERGGAGARSHICKLASRSRFPLRGKSNSPPSRVNGVGTENRADKPASSTARSTADLRSETDPQMTHCECLWPDPAKGCPARTQRPYTSLAST